MNVSIYIFGEFENGYNQYPEDVTSSVFRTFYNNSTSIGQICIHRDGNLMYYSYIRKLEYNRYIGLCIILNDTMLTKFDKLFSMFEEVITYLVTNGYLIQFNEQGEIVTNVEKLYIDTDKIDNIENEIKKKLEQLNIFSTKLPPVDFTVSKDTVKKFSVDDIDEDIIKAGYTFGYTIICKDKGNNTHSLNSYKGVLVRINKEKKEIDEKYQLLKDEYENTLKQKKQYRVVAMLTIVLLLCCFGLFAVFDNLNTAKQDLSDAKTLISIQSDCISDNQMKINQLEVVLDTLKYNYREEQARKNILQSELDTINNKIGKRQSYLITSSSFDFNTGYYSFSLFGLNEESVSFTVRAYGADGKVFEKTESRYVYKGDNSFSIYINNRLDASKWYSFVIFKDNIIIGGGRH